MDLNRKELIDQMNSLFSALKSRLTNLSPVLNTIGEIIESSIDQIFREYGRWDGNSNSVDLFSGGNNRWKNLSARTIKDYKRRGIAPLKRTLQRSQDMRNSINITPYGNSQIAIRMSSPYGAVHNFGYKGEVNVKSHLRKVKTGKEEKEVEVRAHTREMNVPASPFLTLTEDDIQEIIEFIESQLF